MGGDGGSVVVITGVGAGVKVTEGVDTEGDGPGGVGNADIGATTGFLGETKGEEREVVGGDGNGGAVVVLLLVIVDDDDVDGLVVGNSRDVGIIEAEGVGDVDRKADLLLRDLKLVVERRSQVGAGG